MILDPTSVSNGVMVITAFLGAFLLALWFGGIVWTYRDIRQRTRDPLVQALAILLVVGLYLPGLLVYLLLRPQNTLEEIYLQTLEEEALLRSIEEFHFCPGCSTQVKETWMVCPICQTQLKNKCKNCGEPLELSWVACPFCKEVQLSQETSTSAPIDIDLNINTPSTS
jgi:hypothetical protein